MSYSGKFKDKNNNLHPVTSVLYGTCDTAAATAAKVVTCTDFDALMTGVTIRVKFANANTAASPTVNINSTGAKSVYRFGSTAPVDGNSWNAGEVVELVYDGTSFFMTGADDIAAKQNATDNSLETEAKTIVGAINENAGDISSLKSGLTNLDNEVNGSATTYPYADVITINDAVPANLADCSVKVEPVQDLHGQSAPYVGGAGKNKLPLTLTGIKANNVYGTWNDNVYTLAGVTYTVYTDDGGNVTGIKVNGTYNGSGTYLSFWIPGDVTLPAGTYVYSSGMTAKQANLRIRCNDGAFFSYTTNELTKTYEADTHIDIEIVLNQGDTIENAMLYPMIRLSTETDSTFAPYTNICPISGHTEAVVTRCGNNLIENNTFSGVGTYIQSTVFPVIGDYIHRNVTFSGSGAFTFKLFGIKNGVETVIDEAGYGVSFDDIRNNVSQYDYIRVSGYSNDASNRLSNIMVAFTDTDTALPYEPYKGQQYTLALGDTIYGGTVDFKTGVMTVDRIKIVQNDSTSVDNLTALTNTTRVTTSLAIQAKSNNESLCKCNYLEYLANYTYDAPHYYVQSDLFIAFYPGVMNGDEWKAYVAANPLEIVYPIATPFTVQLTPQQIQLLQGTNTLTASTGDISVTVNGVSRAIGALESGKQDKTDYALETTDKTVVGAINEVKGGLATKVEMKTTQDLNSANKTGVYYFAYNAQNVPSAHSGTVLTLTDVSGVTGMQIARVTTENTVYVRFCDNSTWTAWKQLAFTA